MAIEHTQAGELDLERTDRLPILHDPEAHLPAADDAVRMDHTAVMPGIAQMVGGHAVTDFGRPSSIDLPSLAESVRSVEERIARQNADYEALTRSYEKARDAEAAAADRANSLAVDLAGVRAALDAEQARVRELERALSERDARVESARTRVEEALRESERFQGETKTLRESLAAREASITQTLHSLGERDAQLSALQREHASIVPKLEAAADSSAELAAQLTGAREHIGALTAQLKASEERAVHLASQIERKESEIDVTRSELGTSKLQASSYLELLSSRAWRQEFDHNEWRELDARVGAADNGYGEMERERNRLREEVTELESRLATQSLAAEAERQRLSAALAAHEQSGAKTSDTLAAHAQAIAELKAEAERSEIRHATQLHELRAEHLSHIEKILGERAEQIEKLHAERAAQLEQLRADSAAQLAQLEAQAKERDAESARLMAQLKEARRPIESIEEEMARLKEELAVKQGAHTALSEDNAKLQAALERTRGALEEREFLIRRLERSESNSANVLGRIQTSIERLGGTALNVSSPPAGEWTAELVRIDGERPVTYTLSRRTRIGRASGCELQIDSSSVSRHHALVLIGARDAIIEDLNSTNGILVNGRKVSRALLNDGDSITVGEIQFRYLARPAHSPALAHPQAPPPPANDP